MRYNQKEVILSLEYDLSHSLLVEAEIDCKEFTTESVFKTTSKASDFIVYLNGLLSYSDSKKNLRFDDTERRTLVSIVGVINVDSNKNLEECISHGTPTEIDAHQINISKFEGSIHDEPASEIKEKRGQPVPLAYRLIKMADYLLIVIQGRTLNEHEVNVFQRGLDKIDNE